MTDAAKVIGAVRLGLVDIRPVVEELDTEEMKQVPDISLQLHKALVYNNIPSHNSKYAVEKAKPRLMTQVSGLFVFFYF